MARSAPMLRRQGAAPFARFGHHIATVILKYNYSVYDSGTTNARGSITGAITVTSNASQESHPSLNRGRVVAPKLMMMCDSAQTCVSGGTDCPSCGTCATYYYWCETGGGGGGYSPPIDDGSGGGPTGGSSQRPGNHILDANLHIAVNRAINSANSKLADTQCGVALLMNATWDNTSALNQLTLRGGAETAADWFGSISWRDGAGMRDSSGHEICFYACAFTNPGDTTDYVCNSFLQRPYQANTLIHEMLHTLGLPECNANNLARTRRI